MKVATCTPVDFEASPRFFSRDTGLLCRGFQAAGVDCLVVMLGARTASDDPDLVRGSSAELESPHWWRSQRLDLVVLYAWGHPKFLAVARAIRAAGIRLIQSMDTAGLPSPFADFSIWMQTTWAEVTMPQPLRDRLKRIARGGRDFIPSLFERSRLDMMNECDVLAAISPAACISINAYATALGRADVAAKLTVVPHPVSPAMKEEGEPRENRLLVVGRWGKADAAQKDPRLTLRLAHDFLRNHPSWRAEIIGPNVGLLAPPSSAWQPAVRERLKLTEFIHHEELRERYATSRILLCSSRFESFHIASAEAVCCGCSVVVADHPLLASTAWFTTSSSGTLSHTRRPRDFSNALAAEVGAWARGDRSDASRAEGWRRQVHANRIARMLLRDSMATGTTSTEDGIQILR
jgi:glycosyltransferase involved in cell wall biosynthesis